MSRVFQILTVFFLAVLLLNCTGRTEHTRTLTATDSLWLNFAIAMERNDLEYLLTNSLDSIRCVDCNPTTPNWEDEIYEAEYLLRNHLTDLMHLDNLSSGFSTYQDSTLIRVGYSIEAPQAEEGGYTLVFTLERKNGQYLLSDRFFVP